MAQVVFGISKTNIEFNYFSGGGGLLNFKLFLDSIFPPSPLITVKKLGRT